MPNLRNTHTGQILRSKAFVIIFLSIAAFLFLSSTLSSNAARANIHHDSYLSLAILNNEMKTSNYFPGNTALNNTMAAGAQGLGPDDFVSVDDANNNNASIKWNLNVDNGMQNAEYVVVKVKLLNSTQLIPDDLTNQPSPERDIIEFSRIIQSNSKQSIPFEWKIMSISKSSDGQVTINQMMINGKIIDNVKTSSIKGENFRFVFELWRYDNDSSEFQYAWSSTADSPEIKRSVWNQIWFSVMN